MRVTRTSVAAMPDKQFSAFEAKVALFVALTRLQGAASEVSKHAPLVKTIATSVETLAKG